MKTSSLLRLRQVLMSDARRVFDLPESRRKLRVCDPGKMSATLSVKSNPYRASYGRASALSLQLGDVRPHRLT